MTIFTNLCLLGIIIFTTIFVVSSWLYDKLYLRDK